MPNQRIVAGYTRVVNKAQADPQTDGQLEAIRLLQKKGYLLAVAPLFFSGSETELKQLPKIIGDQDDAAEALIRELLRHNQTLVITGKEVRHGWPESHCLFPQRKTFRDPRRPSATTGAGLLQGDEL